jgi:hypothetical protein
MPPLILVPILAILGIFVKTKIPLNVYWASLSTIGCGIVLMDGSKDAGNDNEWIERGYHFSLLKRKAKFHCKMQIAKFKMKNECSLFKYFAFCTLNCLKSSIPW